MSNPAEIAFEITGVRKTLGRKLIYKDLDLSILRGETLTILGPSGSGKSVLLKLLNGLEKPEEGAILLGGLDIVPLKERALREVRRRVAMLFQGAALFDSMNVFEKRSQIIICERTLFRDNLLELVSKEHLQRFAVSFLLQMLPGQI